MKFVYFAPSDFFAVLKKSAKLIVAATLILAILFLALSLLLPFPYAASAEFYVRNLQSEEFLSKNGLTSSQLAVTQTLAKDYAALVTESDALLDAVIEKADLSLSREALRGMLSAESNSTAFTVTVKAPDAKTADAVIAAVYDILPLYIQQTAWPRFDAEAGLVVLPLRAAAPAKKAAPAPYVAVLLGAGLGFLLSYIFSLFRFWFGKRLADEREVTRCVPDVSLLGAFDQNADGGLLPLREILLANENKLLALTPTAGDEAHRTAECLAAAYAACGKRVLVVDADFHGDQGEDKKGLLAVLSENIPLDGVIIKDEKTGVSRLPVGSAADLETVSLASRAKELFGALAAEYDVVLAVLSCCGAYPEAAALAPLFERVLVTVSVPHTSVAALRGTCDALSRVNEKTALVVLK